MQDSPFKPVERLDPKLANLLEETRKFAFSEGALPRKYKLLIALALQAALLADEAIKSFARAALDAGATKEEIAEVLRVVQYINGADGVFTAAASLKDII
jgi:alkylhydroperoxidase/carboxymuconolactone decarboxylase family protein YurZ